MTKYYRVKEDRNIVHTITRRKDNWIGHILRGNCLLKHINVGKINGKIEVTERRWRICKQLSDDLKVTRLYCKLEEEALDLILRGDRFGKGSGPVGRQTTKWINEWMNENIVYFRTYNSPVSFVVNAECFLWNSNRNVKYYLRQIDASSSHVILTVSTASRGSCMKLCLYARTLIATAGRITAFLLPLSDHQPHRS